MMGWKRIIHLERVARIFICDKIGAGQGDVVGEGGGIAVDMVAVWVGR